MRARDVARACCRYVARWSCCARECNSFPRTANRSPAPARCRNIALSLRSLIFQESSTTHHHKPAPSECCAVGEDRSGPSSIGSALRPWRGSPPPEKSPVEFPADRVRGLRRDGQSRSRRSEEHTSELQSRVDLVCRLLLEKKKK